MKRAFSVGVVLLAAVAQAQTVSSPEEIKAKMKKAFEWQIANPTTERAAIGGMNGIRGWVRGAFMTGVMEAHKVTKEPAYADYAWDWAGKASWGIATTRPEHADNHIASATYIDLHRLDAKRADLKATISLFDWLLAGKHEGRVLLWWCDAIYMEPPTLVKLAKETGEKKYLEEMDRLTWDSIEFLYDKEERLFFRDKNYMPHWEGFKAVGGSATRPVKFQEANGKKMFWSRGNGWVLAGIARILDEMPKDWPTRPKWEGLFKEFAGRVLELQGEDGLWRMGLLDQAAYGHGEVSGSAFFLYAFAWGVRNGVLEEGKYWPAVVKGWNELEKCQHADGKVGWVQPIGAAPGRLSAETSQEYGTGAFLLVGSELLRRAEGK